MTPSSQVFIRLAAIILMFTSCGGSSGGKTPVPSSGSSVESHSLESNPVARYLAEPDPYYRFSPLRVSGGEGYTTHVLLARSQRWLDETLVDESLWWHWLTIVVPDEIKRPTALLWIGEGDRDDQAPTEAAPLLVEAALATGTVAALLHNVPFQPLVFFDDDFGPRFEDRLIAHGWRVFMEKGAPDEEVRWLLQVPMAKAVIRAMDTIIEFSAHQDMPVDRFVLAGASKRGWAAWISTVFDHRVIAVAPVVIDLLNIRPSLEHHWRAYGEWSPAIRDYEEESIMDWQLSAEFARSLELIDPYSYRERLTMPKFIVNAASDEFFLPDSWQFYWDDLPGAKYLRYVPDAGHSLAGTDAVQSLIAFHEHTVTGTPLPRFEWRIADGGAVIETDPDHPPAELRLWQVTNPTRRDFRLPRLRELGRAWTGEMLPLTADGRYAISIATPEEGFTAWFVEATFPGLEVGPLKLSTGVAVTPDFYSFPPFVPDPPLGTVISE